MGSKDCYFFAENQRFCRRDGQKHRLTPQDAPRSFPRAFLTVFCFSRVLVRFLAQTIRSLWRVKNINVRTGARNKGSLTIFGENHHVLRTSNMDEQSNYDSGETENCSRKLSKN